MINRIKKLTKNQISYQFRCMLTDYFEDKKYDFLMGNFDKYLGRISPRIGGPYEYYDFNHSNSDYVSKVDKGKPILLRYDMKLRAKLGIRIEAKKYRAKRRIQALKQQNNYLNKKTWKW